MNSIRYRLGAIGLAVLGATGAGTALAQPLVLPYTYVGGSIGATEARSFDNTFGPAVTTSRTAKDDDLGGKLFFGYQFHRNIAVEAGIYHLGDYEFGYTVPGGQYAASSMYRGINVDLVGTWPVWNRLSILGRVGAAYTRAKTSVNATGIPGVGYGTTNDNSWGAKYGLGLEWELNPRTAVRAEWERYRVRDAVRGRGDVDMASVGLVYRFGAPAVQPVRMITPPPPPPPPPAYVPPPPPPPVAPPPPPPPPAVQPSRPYRN